MSRRSLLVDAWPEPDRIAWTRATAEGDVFDGRGLAAHWVGASRDAVTASYGRWLAFLAACEPSALADRPVQRLTNNRLAGYLEHLAQTVGTVGRHIYLDRLRGAVRVMFPGEMPQNLSRLVARLRHEKQPRSNAARIVTTARLIALGEKLMREAAGPAGEITDLLAYRNGLMIALRGARPIRRRTFSLIRIGTHLRRVGEEWRMVFDGSETKSGRPFEITVPERLTSLLERYVREVHPRIAGAHRHDGLWAGRHGGPLVGAQIYGVITARTREAFGQPISPHLFRHCAATTIAIVQPGRIGVARDLLATPRSPPPMATTIRPAQSMRAGSMPMSSPVSAPEQGDLPNMAAN